MTRLLLPACVLLAACSVTPPVPLPRATPAGSEPAAQMAVTAHPLATRAALAMLEKGGSVLDAAVAAQAMLGLVEAQSSGLGGGTLVMHWDAGAKVLSSYDGLAAAPGRTTASLRTDTDGKLLESEAAQRGGRSVGVPGTLAVLALAHQRHGRLAWRELFEPAIEQAEAGFPMAPYMHGMLAAPNALRDHPDLAGLYFRDGRPLPVGALVRNPAYAGTLRRVAIGGPRAYLEGGGAKALVEAAQRGHRATLMTEQDVLDYRAVARQPVCAPFLAYKVCTMAPPSFGGLYVLQVLQMVEARAGGRFDFADPAFVHLYVEAGKLAQADRRQFVGDPDFVPVPVAALADPDYARRRAALIDPQAAGNPGPGQPVTALAGLAPDASDPASATSQIAIVDAAGNAVSITTTINLNFGSRLLADGYVLNNALSNFSGAPKAGERIANQMAPRKRPATSMAPTLVFDREGRAVAVGGSAGGGPIVDYIATSLIEMLANGLTPAQALAKGHLTTAVAGKLQLERGTPAEALAGALAARGHVVEPARLLSGLAFLKRTEGGWIGAADPRRDGVALGLPAPRN